MKFVKRIASIITCVAMLLVFMPASTYAAEKSDDIVILYTNDVHTYIDGALSYDVIAGIKADLQTKYEYVFLADAGDHVQGTAYGAMDKGKSVVTLLPHISAKMFLAFLLLHLFLLTYFQCSHIHPCYILCNFLSSVFHYRNLVFS